MADLIARFRSRARGPGIRERFALAGLLACVAFTAVFDIRLNLAVREYVEAAERAAAAGHFLPVQDQLVPAAREALSLGMLSAAGVLSAGLFASRQVTRAASRVGEQ